MTCLPRVPAVVVAVLVASTVRASPFHYDELVSGDLNYAGTFELGVGVNTITGMTGSCRKPGHGPAENGGTLDRR